MKLKKVRFDVICSSCGHREHKELIRTVGSMWRKSSGDSIKCGKCGRPVRTEKVKE